MDEQERQTDPRIAIISAAIASFLAPFMASSINIALPAIGKEFSVTAVGLGWVATSYILSTAIFLVPFGKLGDIRGRRRVFLAGNIVYTAASLLSALAPTTALLIIFRVVQGIGAAMIFGTSIAIVTSAIQARHRGRAIGVTTAAVYLGLSLGPVIGGFLTQHLGWRSIFWVNVPIGALEIVLVAARFRGEWAEAREERFDAPGAALYGFSLAAIMYGFTRLPAVSGACLIAAGIAGLAGFALWERRSKSPLIDMRLISQNRVFAFSSLAALINYSASFAVGFLMSLYLQYVKGLDAQGAGFVLVAQPVVMTAFSPIAGRLSDRVDPRIVASIGMAITAAALSAFIFLDAATGISAIVPTLALLGFGFALFSSPNTNAVMSAVEPRWYGVASATLGTMRVMGQMFSLGIAMLIFALRIGPVPITPERHGAFIASVHIAFLVFAALSVTGVFASLARGTSRGALE